MDDSDVNPNVVQESKLRIVFSLCLSTIKRSFCHLERADVCIMSLSGRYNV